MLIFVYGTLKRDGSNHHWMQGQKFVAEASTEPHYRLYELEGYPGMVSASDGLSIQGEVWEVDAAGLHRLDLLEDTASGEYVRERLPMQPPFDTQHVEGYRYLLPIDGKKDLGDNWLIDRPF